MTFHVARVLLLLLSALRALKPLEAHNGQCGEPARGAGPAMAPRSSGNGKYTSKHRKQMT